MHYPTHSANMLLQKIYHVKLKPVSKFEHWSWVYENSQPSFWPCWRWQNTFYFLLFLEQWAIHSQGWAANSRSQDNCSSSFESEAAACLRDVGVTTQTGCGAEQSTCVFVCRREAEAHRVSQVSRIPVWGLFQARLPSDSAFNGSWPCKTGSKRHLDWYAASFQYHLCVC